MPIIYLSIGWRNLWKFMIVFPIVSLFNILHIRTRQQIPTFIESNELPIAFFMSQYLSSLPFRQIPHIIQNFLTLFQIVIDFSVLLIMMEADVDFLRIGNESTETISNFRFQICFGVFCGIGKQAVGPLGVRWSFILNPFRSHSQFAHMLHFVLFLDLLIEDSFIDSLLVGNGLAVGCVLVVMFEAAARLIKQIVAY